MVDFCLPHPDDPYIICYTSGTTGNPKGVQHSHRNYCTGCNFLIGKNATPPHKPGPGDRILAFLPLAHVAGLLLEAAFFSQGAMIGYYSRDPRKIMEDFALLKPTIIGSVPRVLNRIYDGIMSKINAETDPKKAALIKMAIASKNKRR